VVGDGVSGVVGVLAGVWMKWCGCAGLRRRERERERENLIRLLSIHNPSISTAIYNLYVAFQIDGMDVLSVREALLQCQLLQYRRAIREW